MHKLLRTPKKIVFFREEIMWPVVLGSSSRTRKGNERKKSKAQALETNKETINLYNSTGGDVQDAITKMNELS